VGEAGGHLADGGELGALDGLEPLFFDPLLERVALGEVLDERPDVLLAAALDEEAVRRTGTSEPSFLMNSFS
jgi:hypothetical protein